MAFWLHDLSNEILPTLQKKYFEDSYVNLHSSKITALPLNQDLAT